MCVCVSRFCKGSILLSFITISGHFIVQSFEKVVTKKQSLNGTSKD